MPKRASHLTPPLGHRHARAMPTSIRTMKAMRLRTASVDGTAGNLASVASSCAPWRRLGRVWPSFFPVAVLVMIMPAWCPLDSDELRDLWLKYRRIDSGQAQTPKTILIGDANSECLAGSASGRAPAQRICCEAHSNRPRFDEAPDSIKALAGRTPRHRHPSSP